MQGIVKVGGFSEVWKYNEEWGRIEFFKYAIYVFGICNKELYNVQCSENVMISPLKA